MSEALPRGFASQVPYQDLAGLRPQAWLCVGAGFSREDVKALLLGRGLGFTGEAITSLPAIALRIAAHGNPELEASRVLGALARQEVLRILLADSRISTRLPELKRLKRQSGFFRKLDLAMQAGRLAFGHGEEGLVYGERLKERFGANPVREELQTLSMAYEAWLESKRLWDPPMVLKRATDVVAGLAWPQRLERPASIHIFSAQHEESLERGFWDALSHHVQVIRVGPLQTKASSLRDPAPWRWEAWHTLDDAAEELAERLVQVGASDQGYNGCVVLIPDTSSARRSLRRALHSRGVPLADPRDPTRLRWEEGLKWATLPIAVVARAFERDQVVSFLRAYYPGPELSVWVSEIHARGIRLGLSSYQGGKVATAHARLAELADALGGRRKCAELGDCHLKFLRLSVGSGPETQDRQWIVPFFEALWRDFAADMERVGLGDRKAPVLYWWERLQARLSESPAPVERFKPAQGVSVYRLHQAPLEVPRRVFVLGLPPQWLSGEGLGDYWFSERERETLSAEFAVRSAIQLRQERLRALQFWIAEAEQVTWLDAAYDADGRERESIDPLLRELAGSLGFGSDRLTTGRALDAQTRELPEAGGKINHEPQPLVPDAPEERGAHSRWLRSYGALRPLPPLEVSLSPMPRQPNGAPPEITATAIDSYSRCGLMALAYQRWKLRDIRDPDTELWPEARGNILHAAVKILLESRDENGKFSVTCREALDLGWKQENPRGLLRSPRAESYVRDRMLQVLEAFRDKEFEYFTRAPSKIASLDSAYFRLDFEDVAIIGTPDRIDEHPDGIFVMDYKTSSSLPNGTDMIDLGYRLQLPFYALAAHRDLQKPVLGVQFVELNRKAGRGSGIFFKKYNGKEAGKLTTLTARSKSLLDRDPEATWSSLAEKVHAHALGLVSGQFNARPKKDKECTTCGVADLCGFRRLTERPALSSGSGGEGGPAGD